MAGVLAIDVKNSFSSMFMLGSAPRMKYNPDRNARPEQDVTKNGEAKYEVQVAVTFHGPAGARIQSEVLSITIVGTDPSLSCSPGPVDIEGLRAGLSTAEAGEGGRVKGGRHWYQADKIVPFGTSTNGSKSYGKSEVAA